MPYSDEVPVVEGYERAMYDDRPERAASGADLAFEEQVNANGRLESLVNQLRERLDTVMRPGEPVGERADMSVARERGSEHVERMRTQAERTSMQADVIERILARLDI